MNLKKVIVVMGTRPEAIKMASIYLALKESLLFEVKLLITAQHRELLDGVLEFFELTPDYDLDIMKDNQDLFDITTNVMNKIKEVYFIEKPDLVLTQGDTTTTFVSSLAAFYMKIKVGHIEAGLRTGNKFSPYPEEMNRLMTSRLADFHFAPTEVAKNNLAKEGVPAEKLLVTGNTVIDALFLTLDMIDKEKIKQDLANKFAINFDNPFILITAHRRENFGKKMIEIFLAIKELAAKRLEMNFIYPVHPNPNVRDLAFEMLGKQDNIFLIEPQEYDVFTYLMAKSTLILSDSGGIQEEAPSLNKPVLVLRDTTERPEAIEAGCAKLVGYEKEIIIREVNKLLDNKDYYSKMANKGNPYGDGTTAKQIVEYLERVFE
jgi:UDP-N-acetylglucosamine 2-epimerase (non-hydrolysing)